jgi:MFS family permease
VPFGCSFPEHSNTNCVYLLRFLVFVVFYNLFGTMASSGILPSVASTLQRQYGLSSTAFGVIFSLFDAISIVLSIPVGYYFATWNKARVSAVGFVLANIGMLLFALPYAVSPSYEPSGYSGTQVCDAGNTAQCVLAHRRPRCSTL